MTCPWYFTIFLTIGAQAILPVNGLYGYDCGDHLSNLTTISLLDIGDCDIKQQPLNISRTHAQFLQLNEFETVQVHKCSIKITRMITHCGMHSHSSRVMGGEISYFKEIARDECLLLQQTGFYSIGETQIEGITKNGTTHRNIRLAGKSDMEGNCKGGSYSDPYGTWDGVYVAGWIEITLQDYFTTVHVETNKIILRSGVKCTFTDTKCIDFDAGQVFWSLLPGDFCGENKYSILYEGRLNKVYDKDQNKIMYSVESDEITFALFKTGEIHTCGFTIARTEHPKLFILEDAHNSSFVRKAPSAAVNLDLFLYVNSKFLYIEKHLKGQLTQMYYNILEHKCELERKVLRNAISIATISPEEFGFRLMEEDGYIGVVAGEVVHLLKCVRVEVNHRNTTECYDQLPVYRGQEEFFLAPRTRILIRTGTQIICDNRMPAMYQLDRKWYKMLPMPVQGEKPEVLKPDTKPTWNYISPETLAIGGIYGEKDLNRLRDMILFPIEKPTVLNKVALGMSGRTNNQQGISIHTYLDKKTIETLAKSTWSKMWGNFLAFGTASAGIIGAFMLGRLIKLLIDTIIHGYAIYSLYGFSIHLIGAIWNSVTQLLLHLGQQRERAEKNKKDEKREQSEHIYDEVGEEANVSYAEVEKGHSRKANSA